MLKLLSTQILTVLTLALASHTELQAQAKPKTEDKFVLVIDPGHGGDRPGTVGNRRYPGVYEKHINLAVSLMVRDLLQKNSSDVKVLMTRTTDTNPTFKYRTDLATKNDADLLVSIHCNAMPSTDKGRSKGALTVVMSLDKSDKNSDIAKLENADMLLEENYKEVYKGFDPNNPQGAIGLGIYQGDRLRKSIEAGLHVQKQLQKIAAREDKGLIQLSDIWLVWASTSPTILIELGFLTNREEEDFLHSKKGQELLAQAVYQGILDYKTRFFDQRHALGSPSGSVAPPPPFAQTEQTAPETQSQPPASDYDTQTVDTNTPLISYAVQLATLDQQINVKTNPVLKKFDKVEFYREGKSYKYTSERVSTFAQAKKLLADASKKGATGAFIIAFEGDKKITVARAREITRE